LKNSQAFIYISVNFILLSDYLMEVSLDTIVAWAKRRGFAYPGSDIYGGLANAWDLGPYGTEVKRNIENAWWKAFVQERDDIIGLDSQILMNSKVWEASGHVG
jgi:glycyl-tRNA synthetase